MKVMTVQRIFIGDLRESIATGIWKSPEQEDNSVDWNFQQKGPSSGAGVGIAGKED